MEKTGEQSLKELQTENRALYEDILPENYKTSYGNPAYAAEKLGEYGKLFSFLYAELRGAVVYAYEKRTEEMTQILELFLEVYSAFAQEEIPDPEEMKGILTSYVNDYCQDMMERRIREGVDSDLTFALDLIMKSDLSDLRYLYQYGEFVSENETGVAEFLNSFPGRN